MTSKWTISKPHLSRCGHDPAKVARMVATVAKDLAITQGALAERFRMGGSTIKRKLREAGWHWVGNNIDGRWERI